MKNNIYEGMGWMHAACCAMLDDGKDPRQADCAELLAEAEKDLGNTRPAANAELVGIIARIEKAKKDCADANYEGTPQHLMLPMIIKNAELALGAALSALTAAPEQDRVRELEAENASLREGIEEHYNTAEDAQVEIERLRAGLVRIGNVYTPNGGLAQDIQDLLFPDRQEQSDG